MTLTIESPLKATLKRTMTTEEFLALPDDGVERWLIDGELREFGTMTVRNRFHSQVMAAVVYFLEAWRRGRPEPRGRVLCGEAGVRLQRDPECVVGVDVAYISPELAACSPKETTLIDGVPILAVEILSPNDLIEDIEEKTDTYITKGVQVVWVINPRRRTVTVHRLGSKPVMLNDEQELTTEPHLPGFRVAVAQLFE